MAVTTKKQRIPSIGDPFETDPAKIADTSTLSGGIKGLVGATAGGIANTNIRTGGAIRKGVGDFLSIGSNAGKPFEDHYLNGQELAKKYSGATPIGADPEYANKMKTEIAATSSPNKAGVPSIVSEASAAELPTAIGNIGASAALGAIGGDPAISAALPKMNANPLSSPTTPTAATVPVIGDDPGSGSALVGGKKVNYQDIGGIGDPLKGGWDGSGKVAGQARNSNSIIGDLIANQDQGISQEYKDQVANAVRINAANGMAPTAEQMKTLGMTNTDLVNVLAANNKDGRYDAQITDLQKQQFVDQQRQKLAIDSLALENDLDYRNKVLAIDAPLKEAQTKNTLAEAQAKEFAISPDGIKQGQAKKLAAEKKDADKFLTDRHDYWRKYLTENTADLDLELTKYAQAVGKDPEALSPEEKQIVSDGFIKSRVIQDLRQRASGSKEAQTMIVAGKLKQAEALLKAQAKNMQPGRNLPGQDAILNDVATLRKQLKQLRGEA